MVAAAKGEARGSAARPATPIHSRHGGPRTRARGWPSRRLGLALCLAGCAPTVGSSPGAPACVEGQHRCQGQRFQACGGGLWRDQQSCPDACSEALGCVACLPDATFCSQGGVTRCGSDGMPGARVGDCPGGACAGGRCVDPCSQGGGSELSYLGCTYWPTVTANGLLRHDAHYAVAVANPQPRAADVTVLRAGQLVTRSTVPAGGLVTLRLPWVDELKDATTSMQIAGGAYQLVAALPVTVYQFNPLEFQVSPCQDAAGCFTYTNDASLLLPQQTLTGHYLVISRPELLYSDEVGGSSPTSRWPGRYPGFVSVVGTAPGVTTVKVTFSAASMAGGPALAAYQPGQVGTFHLGAGDVLQLFAAVDSTCAPASSDTDRTDPRVPETFGYCDLPATDLTGTEVLADQPVAVFAGHECAFVPYNRWACDHLEQQLFPVEAWGKRYAVAKVQRSPASIPDLLRVLSASDGNLVQFEPPAVHAPVTLNRGGWVEVAFTEDLVVSGSAALSVAHFMVGQDYFGLGQGGGSPGDPSMSLAVPVEQYRASYIFVTPASYQLNFVGVTAPRGVDVVLDGGSLLGRLVPFGAGAFSAARVRIGAGTHTISSAMPFGIEVYGLAPYTSYMYPGGLDVKVINIE